MPLIRGSKEKPNRGSLHKCDIIIRFFSNITETSAALVWLWFSDAVPDTTVRLGAQRTRAGKRPKDEGAGVLVIPMGKVR